MYFVLGLQRCFSSAATGNKARNWTFPSSFEISKESRSYVLQTLIISFSSTPGRFTVCMKGTTMVLICSSWSLDGFGTGRELRVSYFDLLVDLRRRHRKGPMVVTFLAMFDKSSGVNLSFITAHSFLCNFDSWQCFPHNGQLQFLHLYMLFDSPGT